MSPSHPYRPFPILLFWRRFTLRHARQEWLQTCLLLLILALGVGTFLSIRMANRAAVQGFQLFTDALRGPSDLIIETPGAGIPLEELPRLRAALDPLPASLFPVVETTLTPLPPPGGLDQAAARQVRLLGLDLVQVRAAAEDAEFAGDGGIWEILEDPEHLLVSREVAGQWGVTTGDAIELVIEGRVQRFVIRGILPEFRDGTPLPRVLAVADIAGVLERTGRATVDRVELVLPESPRRAAQAKEARERLQAAAAGRWAVSAAADKQNEGASMTAAFRLNLTVLSLIALLVGMYLIAQTLDATVSRRRREIATLRSLGVSPREIRRLWLAEALLYGLAAGLLGLLAGYALAFVTVDAVTGTVRALYRDTVAGALGVAPSDAIISLCLGIGGSLVAAWIPANDAAATPPAQFLRLGKRIPPFLLFQRPWIGGVAGVAGALLLLLPPWTPAPGTAIPVAGYAAALLWLTGGTLLAARCLNWTGALLQAGGRHSAAVRLAASRLRQPTCRHQLALSGFFVAIGMAAAMAFMIASFEHTITAWLKHRLRADLFISSIGFQGADASHALPGDLLDALERTPGIRVMDRYHSVEVPIRGVAATLGGSRFDLLGGEQQLLWIIPPRPAAQPPAGADATGYANENLQRRAGIRPGDLVEVPTPAGVKRVWIAGIHADYARDNGLLLVDLRDLQQWYQFSDYATAAVFLEDGADPAAMQALLRERFPGLAIRQNGELRETVMFIFNQTFAVTYALQLIGLAVALTGLTLSLLSLLRESGRELALQRTLGMTRREIALSTAIEGTGVALAGLVPGLLLSIALGNVLIHVINRQSFGWTLQAAVPWTAMLLLAAAVVLLGFTISLITGRLFLRRWRQEAL